MAFDAVKYFEEIAKKSGLPAEQVESMKALLADEKVGATFKAGFVPTNKYQRDLTKMREEAAAREKQIGDHYLNWYEKEALPYITDLESKAGKVPPAEPRPLSRPAAQPASEDDVPLTRKEMKEMIDRLSAGVVDLQTDFTDAAADWYHRFGTKERFPIREVRKFAEENRQWSPYDAYTHFIQPKLDESNKAQREAELKAARDEGAREFASKHHLPIDSNPKGSSPIWDRPTPKEGEKPASAFDAFESGWNEANLKGLPLV